MHGVRLIGSEAGSCQIDCDLAAGELDVGVAGHVGPAIRSCVCGIGERVAVNIPPLAAMALNGTATTVVVSSPMRSF